MRPPAVLLGLDCRTGLQSARLLAARGVHVFGVADDMHAAYCRTRAVRGVLDSVRFCADPTTALRQVARRYDGAAPVLLSCTDAFTLWLDAHRDTLAGAGRWVLPVARDGLETLLDKAKLYRFAAAHGIAIPPTTILTSRGEAEAALAELAFPVVLKPPLRSRAWFEATGGRKVLRVEHAARFLDAYDRCAAAVPSLIVQEWIPGPDSCMYSVYSFRARDGRTSPVVVQKLRQWPPDVGVGSLAVQVDDEGVAGLGLGVLARAGFAGLSSVQIKRHRSTGVAYLIEVNAGRPALNMPIAELCGVEMQLSYYCDAAGLPLPAEQAITRPGGKWICWKTDLASAYRLWRRGDLRLGEWWRSVQGRKVHAVWSGRDPLPFVFDMARKSPRLWRGIGWPTAAPEEPSPPRPPRPQTAPTARTPTT